MKGLKPLLAILNVVLIFSLLFPMVIFSDPSQKEEETSDPKPVVINSNTVEMNNKLKIVTFKGDVNAKKDSFAIDCDEMIVYYSGTAGDQTTKEENKTGIDKIVATGRVVINRAEGGKATADKAIYYQIDDKIVLTGNPTMMRGSDLVKADRITIFLKEDRSVVESAHDSKVSVTIAPNRPER